MARLGGSKLWSLVMLLSAAEDREFVDWLCSPVHNSVKKLPVFYELLVTYKIGNEALPSKQKLYAALYPDQEFRSSTINNLLRDMTAQLESYLAWKGMERNERAPYYYLQELRYRGENHYFFKDSQPFVEAIFDEERPPNFLHDLQWMQLVYYHPSFEGKYTGDQDYWHDLQVALDGFYLEQRYALQHELHNKAFAEKADLPAALPSWLKKLETEELQSPALELYRYRLERKADFDYTDFDYFYTRYLSVFDRLLFRERVVFLTCLTNDAVTLTTIGEPRAYSALFTLYKFGVREALIFHGGGLSSFTFNNMVSVALHEKQPTFVTELMQEVTEHLRADWKWDALAWARGRLALDEEDPYRCLQILNGYGFQFWLYKFHTRLVQTLALADLVFFHEEPASLFVDHAQAFAKFISRQKKHRIRHDRFLNFIDLFRTMIRWYERGILLEQKDEFVQLLSQQQPAYGTEWMRERLRRIENMQLNFAPDTTDKDG